MSRLLKAIILLFLLGVIACTNNKTPGPLTLSVPGVTVFANGQGVQKVHIQVAAPYHFNQDFPSSLKIIDADGLVFQKKHWGQSIFKPSGNGAVASVAFKTPRDTSGSKTIRAVIDCSVCKADECRVFKGLHVNMTVKIKKHE